MTIYEYYFWFFSKKEKIPTKGRGLFSLLFYCFPEHNLLSAFILMTQEINPLYEKTVTKEEAALLVADEYEIDYSALHFTQTVGEGAFGKVMKAELNLSVACSYGALSAAPKVVAVKMLKGE